MRRYTSFDEVNRDLHYLKLKTQIEQEELKLTLNSAKSSVEDTLSPVNIVMNVIGSIAQKAFVMKVIDKLFGLKKVKQID